MDDGDNEEYFFRIELVAGHKTRCIAAEWTDKHWCGRDLTHTEAMLECKDLLKEFRRGTFDPECRGTPLKPELGDWLRVECVPSPTENGLGNGFVYGFDTREGHDAFFEFLYYKKD